MKKYLIFSIILLLFFLLSCSETNPPGEEDEYVSTIIYRIESTTHTTCSLVEYTDENGDIITLNNVDLPWEYQMNVDDNDYVSLHVQETQIPIMTGIDVTVPTAFNIVDASADFDPLEISSTVLNLSNNILHQITSIISSTRLSLNLNTFNVGDDYEIYNRMYFIVGIYRIDETGNEEPLIYTSQLYYTMDTTIDTYAF